MKLIPVIIIVGSILDSFVIKAVLEVYTVVAAKEQFNETVVKDTSSESMDLLQEDERMNQIKIHEKELGAINFDYFIRNIDQKKVHYFYENAAKNEDLNYLINYRNYQLLCLGNISLSTKIQSKLKCRYVDRGVPFLKIAPFKEEEAYLEPRIVIFHDVLYLEEIETIKKLAQPKMSRAQVIDPETGGSVFDESRIADTAWIDRDDHKHIENVYLRVQLMSGLTLTSAEHFQAAYYPLRGKYESHYDFISGEPQTTYNSPPHYFERIATVLFYLNNVEKGGNTVFTKLDVSLTPKIGSAEFWYNLKPNGLRDYLTLHAACPVTSGSKWALEMEKSFLQLRKKHAEIFLKAFDEMETEDYHFLNRFKFLNAHVPVFKKNVVFYVNKRNEVKSNVCRVWKQQKKLLKRGYY